MYLIYAGVLLGITIAISIIMALAVVLVDYKFTQNFLAGWPGVLTGVGANGTPLSIIYAFIHMNKLANQKLEYYAGKLEQQRDVEQHREQERKHEWDRQKLEDYVAMVKQFGLSKEDEVKHINRLMDHFYEVLLVQQSSKKNISERK